MCKYCVSSLCLCSTVIIKAWHHAWCFMCMCVLWNTYTHPREEGGEIGKAHSCYVPHVDVSRQAWLPVFTFPPSLRQGLFQCCTHQLDGLSISGDSHVSALHFPIEVAGITYTRTTLLGFSVCSGDLSSDPQPWVARCYFKESSHLTGPYTRNWTRVLTFAWQALYWLSHLSSPPLSSFFIFYFKTVSHWVT